MVKFYAIVLVITIILKIISEAFEMEEEYEYDNKAIVIISYIMYIVSSIAIVVFSISNIILVIYGIMIKDLGCIALGAVYIIGLILLILMLRVQILVLFNGCMCVLLALTYFISVIPFFTMQSGPVRGSEIELRKVKTINIIELQTAPYTNVSNIAGSYFIRSEPSLAYYYAIKTKKNGRTTKVIDGYNNYVEIRPDDIYKENPHIDVFEVVERYTNGYGTECEDFKNYEYYIYIPENSTYFVE